MPATRAFLLLLAAAPAFAQSGQRPAYEAASVKLNTSGSTNTESHGTGGQVVMTNQSLDRLIQRAYGVSPMQVTGPDWLWSVHVDIAAKYPAGASEDDRFLMLRTLLEDRFKLAAHNATKELPGYALVAAKSGFKLKPEGECEQQANHNGGRIETLSAKCTSMDLLAHLLGRYLNAMVENKTGIDGAYNIELRWSSQEPKPGDPDTAPTLFDALQESLGLRLRAEKVPVEMVVVDHIERVPTEN